MKLDWRYSTHMPVLMKAVSITTGPVLEMGAGIYSTPLLHWMCFPTKRKLVTMEHAEGWLSHLGGYKSDTHDLVYVPDWDKADIEHPWDVVLIDQEEAARRATAKRLVPYAKYIVMHDSDLKFERLYHYSEIYSMFKYRYDYREVSSNTVVLSNLVDLSDFKV